MSSILHNYERRISSSSTLSAPSIIAGVAAGGPQEQNLSQASQSSRIVTVPHNATNAYDRTRAMVARIEAIFESMVDVLTEGGDTLTMPYRRSSHSPHRPLGSLDFPGRNLNEATKFTQMMRIMELSREALVSGHVITKRNIYYQNMDLFKDQSVVDHLVDDLACTLGIGRTALNIVAASKGLVVGPLRLIMANGSVISCASDHDNSNSIPPISNIHQVDFADTRWILIIEKEATFRTLAASQYWRYCTQGQGLIVTGKGYADLATLEFLNLLHTLRPNIPLLCVVDCDPHGIDIMRTYKHGSKSLGHELNTRVPGLQWLGVKMDDVFLAVNRQSLRQQCQNPLGSQGSDNPSRQELELNASQESVTSAGASRPRPRARRTPLDSLIQLTPRDRKTTQRILQSIVGGDEDAEPGHEELEQIRELQLMLMLNMKAEIQAIDDMGDLSSWLEEKMGMA